VAAIGSYAVTYLGSQLPGRRQNQGADARFSPAPACFVQTLKQGQGEAGGLTCAGLRSGQNVAAFENEGNGLLLDRRRLTVSLIIDRAQELGRQAKVLE
jgi:hypothetical protein